MRALEALSEIGILHMHIVNCDYSYYHLKENLISLNFGTNLNTYLQQNTDKLTIQHVKIHVVNDKSTSICYIFMVIRLSKSEYNNCPIPWVTM